MPAVNLKEIISNQTQAIADAKSERVKILEAAADRDTDLTEDEDSKLKDLSTAIKASETRINLANQAMEARADLDATKPVETPDEPEQPEGGVEIKNLASLGHSTRKGIETRFFKIGGGYGVPMKGSNGVSVGASPRMYMPMGNGERIADCYLPHAHHGVDGKYSFMLDLMLSANGDIDAIQRLQIHNKQELEETTWHKKDWKSFATGTTNLDGFIVPGYFTELYGGFLYKGRPTANICRQHELRGKTNTLPKSKTRTTVGKADENATPTSTDFETDDITATMQIMRGWTDVSRESITQPFSDLSEDLVLEDMIMDYNESINNFVLSNSGTNQQGITEEAGTAAVSATNASRYASWQVYNLIIRAISNISTNTARAADIIILSPQVLEQLRMLASAGDWPLLGRDAGTARNIVGIGPAAPAGAEQPSVGDVQLVPAIQDWAIPGNDGSTGQIIVACRDELHLFGGYSPMAARYEATESKSGKVTFVVHGYVAFSCARFPAAVAKVSGTGLKSA